MTAAMAPAGSSGQGMARLAAAGGLLLAAFISACAPRPAPTPPPPAPPPPVVEEAPAPVTPAEAARGREIALLVPLSGANAPVGQSLANAARLALLDANAQGVRLSVYDTAAAGGAAAAARRAREEGVGLILGPLLATDVTAVRQVADAAGVPVLAFTNDAALAGGLVHVLGFQPQQSVARVVAHARSEGIQRFGALVPEGVYGQRASVAFTRAVREAGGTVAAVVDYPRRPQAVAAAARRVADYDRRVEAAGAGAVAPGGTVRPVEGRLPPPPFGALLIADSGSLAAAFVPALQRHGVAGGVTLMGTELWAAEPGLARVSALHGARFAAVPEARFRQMAARYRERHGAEPSRLASLAYDAMLLAVSLADRWQPGRPLPAAALADRRGFAGVDGIFRFEEQVAVRGLEVMQVTPQGFRTVSAAPRGF